MRATTQTKKIKGLHESDFIMAAKLDRMADEAADAPTPPQEAWGRAVAREVRDRHSFATRSGLGSSRGGDCPEGHGRRAGEAAGSSAAVDASAARL